MPTITKALVESSNGNQLWISPSEVNLIETLEHCNKGGAACIHDYVASSKRISPETSDYQVITRFNYTRLLNRTLIALNGVNFADVNLDTIPDNKLKGKSRQEWFNDAKDALVAAATKTIDGDRSDARRQGHDRCYESFGDGIKVHYQTEKVDGIMQPVLTNGYPSVESVKLSVLILNKTVKVEGEYKPVNSGALVLAKNAINKVMNQRSIGIRTLSLKAGSFSKLSIDHNVIIGDDIKGLMD